MKIFVSIPLLMCASIAIAESWRQVSDGTYMLECPDFIEFSSVTYEILNDCYGEDPRYPVIETGSYSIEKDFIVFTERQPKQESFLSGDAKSQNLELHRSDDSIKLVDGSNIFYFVIEGEVR